MRFARRVFRRRRPYRRPPNGDESRAGPGNRIHRQGNARCAPGGQIDIRGVLAVHLTAASGEGSPGGRQAGCALLGVALEMQLILGVGRDRREVWREKIGRLRLRRPTSFSGHQRELVTWALLWMTCDSGARRLFEVVSSTGQTQR